MKLVCSFRLMLYQIYGWGLLCAPASLEGDNAETNSDDAVRLTGDSCVKHGVEILLVGYNYL